jgi:hypothetical protein
MDLDLAEVNLSELVLIAKEVNADAHRGLGREALLAIIELGEVKLPQRLINKKRLAVMQYINDNWKAVSYQVSCPAKTQSPTACFGCSDLQAVTCVLDNYSKFKEPDE